MRPLNVVLMKLRRRAEAADPEMLVETFVDVGPLFARLSTPDHQILSGRRGTGKTHALYYLEANVRLRNEIPIFVDMRTIGSTGGLYADQGVPITERGTRLLCDTLEIIHDALVDFALSLEEGDPTPALRTLDQLADAISDVVVVGGTEQEEREVAEQREQDGAHIGATIGPSGPEIEAGLRSDTTTSTVSERVSRQAGVTAHRVHFGAVGRLMQELIEALPANRLWILLDEWSDVPMELQPLLADLLRRALFPVRGITVKIGAIEQRSHFRVVRRSSRSRRRRHRPALCAGQWEARFPVACRKT